MRYYCVLGYLVRLVLLKYFLALTVRQNITTYVNNCLKTMLIFNLTGKFGRWTKRFLLNFKVLCDIDINHADKFGKT